MSDIIIYLKPYSEEWHKLNYTLLKQYHGSNPCKNCGHPTLQNYCCTFCYDENPYKESKLVIKENDQNRNMTEQEFINYLKQNNE